MTRTAQNIKETRANRPILHQDANQAMRELVHLSKKLVAVADQETQNLITGDHLGFAFIQKDKEDLAARYAQASEEFHSRLEDFRSADKSILMQLDKAQTELKEKTENNNVLIDSIKKRAAANTQATLFTAQEIGQRVTFPQQNTEQNNVEYHNEQERVSS